jgi:phosphopantothenoylcysteine decarboxylase/phosphopantothenate--cysteine ligase
MVGPAVGSLACGYEGPGRLAAPDTIVEHVLRLVTPADLGGERVLISAGPTQEALDPVRYLSNRSSGKMGYALAKIALRRGADVTLVTGPCDLTPPPGVRTVGVTTAAEMAEALSREFKRATLLVMAAAVADYRPTRPAPRKMKKQDRTTTIALTRTEDILTGLARRKGKRLVVGFAAETHDMERAARGKLRAKKLDLVVANDVTQPGAGFGGDTNVVRLLGADGSDEQLPLLSKDDVAGRILDWIVARRPRRS